MRSKFKFLTQRGELGVGDGLLPGGVHDLDVDLGGFLDRLDKTKGLVHVAAGAEDAAQRTTRVSRIFSAVASPMAFVPQTIHGSTETPSGNTTMHSVHICHSVFVKARSSRSWT